jgi:hypothetical protein
MSVPDPDDLLEQAMRHAEQHETRSEFDVEQGLERLAQEVRRFAPVGGPIVIEQPDAPVGPGEFPDPVQNRRFVVQCPACGGSGHVVPFGSRTRVGCRLCWERGRVSRIVAEAWSKEHRRKSV